MNTQSNQASTLPSLSEAKLPLRAYFCGCALSGLLANNAVGMTMIDDSGKDADKAYYFRLDQERHRLANYAISFGTKLYQAYLAEEEDYLDLTEEEREQI